MSSPLGTSLRGQEPAGQPRPADNVGKNIECGPQAPETGRMGRMVPRGECTFALLLEYDGRGFRGWQKQPGMVTVQGVLEEALRTLLGGRHSVAGAARTDAGVHAEGQVASFRGPGAPLDALKLPTGVRLLRWARAAHSFHARASAIGKQYRYQLAQVVQDGRALDWARARAALRSLEGLSDLRGLSAPSRNR